MSKEQISERKKIKKDVKYLVEQGESKQQILEKLSYLYKDRITIMKQLEATPSRTMKYKFRTYNYILAALLLIVLVLDVIALSRSQRNDWIIDISLALNVLLDVVILINVLLYRVEIYSWIAVRAVVPLVTILTAHTLFYQIDMLVFVSLTLIVVSFILGTKIGVKLCPPRVPKSVEVNVGENHKINKTIYVFPD